MEIINCVTKVRADKLNDLEIQSVDFHMFDEKSGVSYTANVWRDRAFEFYRNNICPDVNIVWASKERFHERDGISLAKIVSKGEFPDQKYAIATLSGDFVLAEDGFFKD